MRTSATIAAGLFASGLASAALVGSATVEWDESATSWDAGIDELYSHVSGAGNNYQSPDGNENRFANGTTLGTFDVVGSDRLDLFNLSGKAAEINVFGVRIAVGGDTYEVSLTPSLVEGAETAHYFASIDQILAEAGGPALVGTAQLDFYINNISEGVRIYSSEMGFDPDLPLRPAFNFTPDLLENPGLSTAKPLPGGATDALAFLNDGGFEVWGLEDSPQSEFPSGAGEPDYNDRMFAFRIVPVPEPSTYGLIGALALAGAALLRRRSRGRLAQ